MERESDGRRTFVKANAPDQFVINDLTERKNLLKDKLKACPEDLLALRILQFFRRYGEIEFWDKPKIKKKLEVYQGVLWDLPMWAFDLAERRARDRLDPSKLPNPNELRILVLSEILKAETELRDIMEVLDAKIVEYREETPEHRDEVIRRCWLEGARRTVAVGGDEDELRQQKERHDRLMNEMVEGSDALRKRWQEHEGVDPEKTAHSPALLAQYGLLGQYGPDREVQSHRGEENDGHTNEPDRSRTA